MTLEQSVIYCIVENASPQNIKIIPCEEFGFLIIGWNHGEEVCAVFINNEIQASYNPEQIAGCWLEGWHQRHPVVGWGIEDNRITQATA